MEASPVPIEIYRSDTELQRIAQYRHALSEPYRLYAQQAADHEPVSPDDVRAIYRRNSRLSDREWLEDAAQKVDQLASWAAERPDGGEAIEVPKINERDFSQVAPATSDLQDYVSKFLMKDADQFVKDELEFAQKEYRDATVSNEIDAVKNTARYISRLWGLAFNRQGLRKLGMDETTGIRNRRSLGKFQSANEKEDKSLKDGSLYIMLDIDNFGIVNKVEDHTHGDMMLMLVAGALQTSAHLNNMDIAKIFRGKMGDEFVVVAPDEETGEKFVANAQTAFREILHKEDDEQLNRVVEGHRGIYETREGGTYIVSVSGAIGRTLEEADGNLQAIKKENKDRRNKEYLQTREYPLS